MGIHKSAVGTLHWRMKSDNLDVKEYYVLIIQGIYPDAILSGLQLSTICSERLTPGGTDPRRLLHCKHLQFWLYERGEWGGGGGGGGERGG